MSVSSERLLNSFHPCHDKVGFFFGLVMSLQHPAYASSAFRDVPCTIAHLKDRRYERFVLHNEAQPYVRGCPTWAARLNTISDQRASSASWRSALAIREAEGVICVNLPNLSRFLCGVPASSARRKSRVLDISLMIGVSFFRQ